MSSTIKDNEVYLRAFISEDENFLIKIRENANVFALTAGNKYFSSREHTKKLLRENFFSDGKNLYLMICMANDNSPVGYLSISEIDHINKKVKFGGIIIDESFSGRGIATNAARQMLKFVFEELNMNKIYGFWLEKNIASLKMASKLGFIQEGVLREYVFKGNQYLNVLYLSILRNEYLQTIQSTNK
ncbi:GNAT family protein [Mycoplasmatota bacterium WC30]